MAERAGFDALWISDHYHPWLDAQGESSFVWSVIGAISQVTSLPITTAVTCPTTRIHPAIIAQAAATAGLLTGGRFNLGVGTGEALNEHVTGAKWPAAEERQEMLEEAVTIIAELFTGESAQLLSLPRHFEQLAELVTEDLVSAPCGPDPEPYIKAIRDYQEAGFDEVYLGQVGGRLEGAFDFLATQVLPQVRGS
jgi:alkanesulfonate monooxygenase SsuD/methylene tetrahydromethanopterin reductase-like flavin-dependent oxidoreductase (luciferase family)